VTADVTRLLQSLRKSELNVCAINYVSTENGLLWGTPAQSVDALRYKPEGLEIIPDGVI
jgi:hypothetical protein